MPVLLFYLLYMNQDFMMTPTTMDMKRHMFAPQDKIQNNLKKANFSAKIQGYFRVSVFNIFNDSLLIR